MSNAKRVFQDQDNDIIRRYMRTVADTFPHMQIEFDDLKDYGEAAEAATQAIAQAYDRLYPSNGHALSAAAVRVLFAVACFDFVARIAEIVIKRLWRTR